MPRPRLARVLAQNVKNKTERFEAIFPSKEAYYRELIERSQDLWCVHTLDGTLLAVNERPARLLGYSVPELLRIPLMNLLAPEFRSEYPLYISRIRDQGSATGTMTLLTRTGERRVWEYRNTLRRGRMSDPVVQGVACDVTERVAAERELRKHLKETTLLRDLGQMMSSSHRLDDVLRAAVEGIQRSVAPDLLILFMREEGDVLRLKLSSGVVEQVFRGTLPPLHRIGQCLCGEALKTASPVYSTDITVDPRCTWEECKKAGMRSFAALPLRDAHGSVIGILGLGTLAVRDFSRDAVFLETLATEICFAIKNCILLEQAQHRASQLEREISDRQEAERRRRESEMYFDRFVQSAPVGMHVYQLDAGNRLVFVRGNPAADQILGIKHEDIVGKAIEEAFPSIGTEVTSAYRRIAESGGMWNVEQIDYEDSRIRGSYELRAFQTGPGSVGVMFTDITERVRAAQALRDSETRLRSFVASAPYGIEEVSLKRDCFLAVNPALTRMLGYESDSDVLALKFSSVFADPAGHARFLANIGKSKAFSGLDVDWVRYDGKRIRLRISGRVKHETQSDDEIIEAIAEDVSDLRVMEERFYQAQKMEAVGRLAGGVAHDFNNMLSVILGYSQLLSDSLETGRLRQLQQIKIAAERAAALTSQLLAFSRKQVLYPRVIDVGMTIVETDKMVRRMIGEDVQLRLHLAPKPWFIHADPAQITQVLMNLAVNARDAMPNGGNLVIATANLRLKTQLNDHDTVIPPGDFVVISVSDTGIGMDAETRAQIFDPFFTTKPEGKGTGLGLATVYGVVHQAGGYIAVSSELGRGTTFNLYLPRVRKAAPSVTEQDEISRVFCGTETILIAEDTSSLREFLCEALRDSGYSVLSAANGADALQVASAHDGSLDLLITDVIMPYASGPDLATQIAAARPGIKVLYMSGYADDRLKFTRALDSRSYIQKPFTISDLTKKIRLLLGRPNQAASERQRGSPDAD